MGSRPVAWTLIDQLLAGSSNALAQIISRVENESPQAPSLLDALYPHSGTAYRLGITGPPGVGKSTLVDKLIKLYREASLKLGILSVDPTSPFTGGALLGDRLRMSNHQLDEGVFIRSMATRGETGGLAARTQEVGDVLDAAGFDVLIFETVGVGQVELDVVETVDTTMVVLVPESGDEIQLMKAGILEIADVLVINKSDREGAGRLRRLLEQMLALKENDSPWKTPVCMTSATQGDGIAELGELLGSHQAYLEKSGRQEHNRRQRVRQKVEMLVDREVLADFWNQDRRDALDTGLETMAPYKLARSILDMS
ncbi:MAG: methylmalonyl Co-A mutase-associated GTPase MeaB [Fidelibacterota bacterium]|nr:MAG: methylmalonyl Co-A mutase-associated GTPase MeaB [Candidatus Neomarinimicrobiota bacterium]